MGHRAQGLEVLNVLPQRNWPGLSRALQCRGSGAPHHTAREGPSTGRSASLPQATQHLKCSAIPASALKFTVFHGTVRVGVRVPLRTQKKTGPGQGTSRKDLDGG